MRKLILVLTVALVLGGCKVSGPGRLETAVLTRTKRLVTVGNKGERNPLTTTKENIDAGRTAFAHYCYVCHGLDGQNTGVPFADHMSPPVPNLKSQSVQGYTDGQLKAVIRNGLSPSGMPASRDILNDQEIWEIVVYIRNLPPAGSLGEPRAYSGDEEPVASSSR